jgi:hypothetical protein
VQAAGTFSPVPCEHEHGRWYVYLVA